MDQELWRWTNVRCDQPVKVNQFVQIKWTLSSRVLSSIFFSISILVSIERGTASFVSLAVYKISDLAVSYIERFLHG